VTIPEGEVTRRLEVNKTGRRSGEYAQNRRIVGDDARRCETEWELLNTLLYSYIVEDGSQDLEIYNANTKHPFEQVFTTSGETMERNELEPKMRNADSS
jgi:hypothetical protein